MKKSHNYKSITSILMGLIIVALLICAIPMPFVYAANRNPLKDSIDFPSAGSDITYMESNTGTISTLYNSGTINENHGTIITSYGTVNINYGTINKLFSSNVGINHGTIETISNTGTLGVNDFDGTVNLNNGNTITRNDGRIVTNYGSVSSNYGQIDTNYGQVNIYHYNGSASKILNNESIGKVTFMNDGVVENNDGAIIINGATVSISQNTGTITLENNAKLICENNFGTIIKADNATEYNCKCTNNFGTIGFDANSDNSLPYTRICYRIEFSGDDGKASVITCEYSYNSNNYTAKGCGVEFTLPEQYACTDASMYGSSGTPGTSTWFINVNNTDEENKKFTIVCHLCSANDYYRDETGHKLLCSQCNRILSQGSHTFGPFVSDNNATYTADGTKTHICTLCGYSETVTDTGSRLTSNNNRPSTDPSDPGNTKPEDLPHPENTNPNEVPVPNSNVIPGVIVPGPANNANHTNANNTGILNTTAVNNNINNTGTETDDTHITNDTNNFPKINDAENENTSETIDIIIDSGALNDEITIVNNTEDTKTPEKETSNSILIIALATVTITVGTIVAVYELKKRKHKK